MTENRKNLRILMVTVLFAAVSFILIIFPTVPIIPGASFLELEISIVPLLLLAHFYGIKYGLLGLLLRSILYLILLNKGVITWIGLPINIVAVIVFFTSFFSTEKTKYLVGDYFSYHCIDDRCDCRQYFLCNSCIYQIYEF